MIPSWSQWSISEWTCTSVYFALNKTQGFKRITNPHMYNLIIWNNYYVSSSSQKMFLLKSLCKYVANLLENNHRKVWHCVKSVQIQSFFWPLFSRSRAEYGKIWTGKNSAFGQFSGSLISIKLHSSFSWIFAAFVQNNFLKEQL